MNKRKIIIILIILALPIISVTTENVVVKNIIDKILGLFDNVFTYIVLISLFLIFTLKDKNKITKLSVTKEFIKIILLVIATPFIVILLAYLFLYLKINLIFLLVLVLVFLVIYSIYNFKSELEKLSGYKFGKTGKEIFNNDVNYFTGIPCQNNIFKTYFLTRLYTIEEKPSNKNLLGGLLLKWFFEGKLEIKNNNDINVYNRDKQFIVLKPNLKLESDIEDKLYNMLYLTSRNGILSKNEIEDSGTDNCFELIKWFGETLDYGRNLYINDGLIYKENNKYIIKDELKAEAIKLVGLRKYLVEFSRISKKIPIEINLYKDYLLYAQIFGMSDLIVKKFSKFYSDEIYAYDNNFNISLIDSVALIDSISKSIIDSSIKTINERKTAIRSSRRI